MGVEVNFFDAYKNVSNLLNLAGSSKSKLDILMTLNWKNRDSFQLESSSSPSYHPKELETFDLFGQSCEIYLSDQIDLIDYSSSNIIHTLNDMENEGLIKKSSEEGYVLTNLGKIETALIFNLIKVMASLSKNCEFWLTHDISGIPKHLLSRIGELLGCEILRVPYYGSKKALSYYVRVIKRANKELKGVSPFFHQDLSDAVEFAIAKKVKVELVLTNDVVYKILEAFEDRLEDFKEYISSGIINIWVTDEDLKEGFAVSETTLLFGLFKDDGIYDLDTNLISHSNEALSWARELFEHYRSKATRIHLKDF